MKRVLAIAIALALAGACISDAGARGGGRGGGRVGGGVSRPSGGVSRPSGGVSRPSGAISGAPGGGGFNLSNDMRPVARPGAPGAGGIAGPGGVQRPGSAGGGIQRPPNGAGGIQQRPGGGGGGIQRPPPGTGGRPPLTRPPGAPPPVPPPRPPPPNWHWNGGAIWVPAPIYWGGGFWGPWAFGVTTAIAFGSIVDNETHETVTSYEVTKDSPGAKVLEAYELTQTPCGPPGLVVIHGPDNAPVCAQPNSSVAAGDYYLDVSNLTLYSKPA